QNLPISSVPLANLGISNTPIGPFQTTVLASFNTFLNSSTDLGPISRAIQPSSISPSTTFVSASLLNLSATTLSIGNTSLSPALSKICLATSILSFSTSELPTLIPLAA